jgi:endonuclease YncB( thermonuclease family)
MRKLFFSLLFIAAFGCKEHGNSVTIDSVGDGSNVTINQSDTVSIRYFGIDSVKYVNLDTMKIYYDTATIIDAPHD